MDYDIGIIGAGMSGLAAGIRLAHFGKRVCIFERHDRIGGLNSYYTRNGRLYDVGLHALTNITEPEKRRAPLNKLLRQLRINRRDLDLRPQNGSSIEFPDKSVVFNNDIATLLDNLTKVFPKQAGNLACLLEDIEACDAYALEEKNISSRAVLQKHLSDPELVDMLMCPVLFYGGAAEDDMPFQQYAVLFRSIFLEGLGRPRDGIRRILKLLKTRYRECGGELTLNNGVKSIQCADGKVDRLVLDDGLSVKVGGVLSSAGYAETLKLCSPPPVQIETLRAGQLSFVETIFMLDRPAHEFGMTAATVFLNEQVPFSYHSPEDLVDMNSAVICIPGNFAGCGNTNEACEVRITRIANPAKWFALQSEDYRCAKQTLLKEQIDFLERRSPGICDNIVDHDIFTPRTVFRYTGHMNGAVYGSPDKHRSGCTPIQNLFISGTDQGFLGIVGALMSGVSMANIHFLAKN